jgi:hypothetical protein
MHRPTKADILNHIQTIDRAGRRMGRMLGAAYPAPAAGSGPVELDDAIYDAMLMLAANFLTAVVTVTGGPHPLDEVVEVLVRALRTRFAAGPGRADTN